MLFLILEMSILSCCFCLSSTGALKPVSVCGWVIAILIILLISLSRLYLGVHFLHDVIIGWLIGALLLWLILRFWGPVTIWLKKMSLGQQILAAFLCSPVLVLFSTIP
jgi:membrane-associated phospholipid phosphatase